MALSDSADVDLSGVNNGGRWSLIIGRILF